MSERISLARRSLSKAIYRLTLLSVVIAITISSIYLPARPVRAAGSRFPLGSNVSRVTDYGSEFAFNDVFRTSRPWFSGSNGIWQDTRTLDLDPHGWVRSLQPNQIARTLLFWGTGLAYPAGRYTVEYQGEGTIQYTPNVRRVESSAGHEIIEVDPTHGGIGMFITAVNANNYLRNIHVYLPNAIMAETFNPVFLNTIRSYKVIRFKDWMAIDGNYQPNSGLTQAHWSERPTLADARWSANYGVPLEVMVELANLLNVDAWFCMPHLADDDYVRQFASNVRQLLNPNLKVYIEYSNEVWNNGYAQANYARQQGLALNLSQNPAEAQARFNALRARQIFGIWEDNFGKDRLVRVLGSFIAIPAISTTELTFRDTLAHTDALAVAPYFGVPQQYQSQLPNMNLDTLFGFLQNTSLPQLQTLMRQQSDIAKRYNVALISYEAGQNLVGLGTYQNDAKVNALFDAANRDPRMGTLYTTFLQNWQAAGGQLMVHFNNCSRFSVYGRNGSLEYLDQPRAQAPKYDALQRWIEGQ